MKKKKRSPAARGRVTVELGPRERLAMLLFIALESTIALALSMTALLK